jgi:hypothetical protein
MTAGMAPSLPANDRMPDRLLYDLPSHAGNDVNSQNDGSNRSIGSASFFRPVAASA